MNAGPVGSEQGKTRVSAPGVDAFEKLVARLNYPMFVVTTAADGVSAGCLVGFAGQASIHPPRFLVGLSKRNHTFRVAGGATHLAVHVFDREHLDVVEGGVADAVGRAHAETVFGHATGVQGDGMHWWGNARGDFQHSSGEQNAYGGSGPAVTALMKGLSKRPLPPRGR